MQKKKDVRYRCPGAEKDGLHRPCGLEIVVCETGEEGVSAPVHCARMEPVKPSEKPKGE